jgi:FdhD protein
MSGPMEGAPRVAGAREAAAGGDTPQELVVEEPLSIVVEGLPCAVVMRTPGLERAHAAGFALAEGILASRADLEEATLAVEGEGSDVVSLTLSARGRAELPDRLQRRSIRRGLRGEGLIRELMRELRPFDGGGAIAAPGMLECVRSLCARQEMRWTTKASHAAALFDGERRLLACAEDVGRNNAVDKSVGELLLRGELQRAAILLVSSRLNYELVQKAARARIPVVLGLSHPSALAVELGRQLEMTLVAIRGEASVNVYCGRHRVR